MDTDQQVTADMAAVYGPIPGLNSSTRGPPAPLPALKLDSDTNSFVLWEMKLKGRLRSYGITDLSPHPPTLDDITHTYPALQGRPDLGGVMLSHHLSARVAQSGLVYDMIIGCCTASSVKNRLFGDMLWRAATANFNRG